MNKLNELLDIVRNYGIESFGNRSLIKKMVRTAEENGELDICLEQAFEVLSITDFDVMPLTILCSKIAANMAAYLDIETAGKKQVISAGATILDWFAMCEMIGVEKREQVKEGKDGKRFLNEVWFAYPINLQMAEKEEKSIFCDPRKPYRPWTANTRYEDGIVVPIVKKADRHGMLHHYTPEQVPMQYRVLNRLAQTPWVINRGIYEYAQAMTPDNSPRMEEPTGKQLFFATKAYADVKVSRKNKKAAQLIRRAKGQRKAYDSTMRLAKEYLDYELNFTYNCGANSRMYCLAPTLTPQGSDLSKALLWCNWETKMNIEDFHWHIANCAGKDKLLHHERNEWVIENMATLRAIGQDPIGSWDIIQEMGVHKEKKTYFQFIAACMELDRLEVFLALGGDINDFTTGILLGMDSTSSGNQILAMIAKDDQVAWEVNIAGGDGRGDLYGKVGKEVHKALKTLTLDDCEDYLKERINMDQLKALSELPEGHKVFRNITKRPCMVLPYSGTRRGAADIMLDDQDDFQIDEIQNLEWASCRQLGYIIHDECKKAAKKSMEIMSFLVDGIAGTREEIDGIDAGTPLIVTWRVPQTNFLCFQYKEETDERPVVVSIGGVQISLKFYEAKLHKQIPGRKRGSTVKHKNAIAPGVVHSLDATLMALIMDGLPQGMPVSAIHDQFCVPMGFRKELVDVAKDAYISVGSRESFKQLCDEAFGERELPTPGTWNPRNLDDSEYFIS